MSTDAGRTFLELADHVELRRPNAFDPVRRAGYLNPVVAVGVVDGAERFESVETLPYPSRSAQTLRVEEHNASVRHRDGGRSSSDVDEERHHSEQWGQQRFDSSSRAREGDDCGADLFTFGQKMLNALLEAALCAAQRVVTVCHGSANVLRTVRWRGESARVTAARSYHARLVMLRRETPLPRSSDRSPHAEVAERAVLQPWPTSSAGATPQ